VIISRFIRQILPVILLLVAGEGRSQLYFKAKTLTGTDGLSDKRVTCFYKDHQGFMWIGTRNGLNRYDGHSFRVFRPNSGNSISNEVINDIAEDKNGLIWVATMAGLNYYDPVKQQWGCLIPNPDKTGNELPNYIVWDIWIDAKGLMWIASDVFEFCSYDHATKKFTYYNWPDWAREHLNFPGIGHYNSIHRFVARDENVFWLGTTKGMVRLDTRKKEFSFLGSGYYGDVIDIAYDRGHKKVFMTVEKGQMFAYDEEKKVYGEINAKPESYPSSQFSLPGNDELWLASQNGLIKITDDRQIIQLSSNIPQLSGSLLPGGVSSVYIDNTGIRWVGTGNGISIYDPAGKVSSFLPLMAVSDKEGSNRMGGVYFDDQSQSYFVCSLEPAAVFVINAVSGNIRKITSDSKGNPLSQCNAVRADNENNLWLLTEKQVYRYDRATGSFSRFELPGSTGKPAYRDLIQDMEGNYWISSFNNGLYYYLAKEKKFAKINHPHTKYLGIVTGLASDPAHHKVLLGTFGSGMFTYDLVYDTLAFYYETDSTRNYSQLTLVHDVEMDSKGQAWVATHAGGVFRYNAGMPYGKTFTLFDMKQGLSSNQILAICSDGDSTLWLLSGNGISAMSNTGRFLHDVKEDKAFSFSSYSSDARLPHYMFFDRGRKQLLVGVGGGMLIYSTAAPDSSRNIPLVITGVRIGGKALSTEEINASSHRVPFRFNAVSFDFAALYYGDVSGISYQYKLEGYDTSWIDAGNLYAAIYQNLPGGRYDFHVRAVDSKGNVAGTVSGFSFYIISPFWETAWFLALAVLLMIGALYWITYSLRQKLKAEQLISSFATSLYGQNTIDDILWDTARNCIQKLGFADCVIYQVSEERNMLVQRAAFGPKNPQRREILNKIEIPVGKGIVGTVASTGKAEIIGNTARDPRYIVDDERRLSEIAVPMLVDGKVFAVIDSEHPRKRFYKKYHLRLLKKVASICSERISKYLTEERLRSKIARDLHDEMGSTLTSINIISKVAMEGNMKDEQVKFYLQKIKDNSGRMMESMSDIVWAINPANDSFEKVLLRMKEFAAEILEPARINYFFREEESVDKGQLNLEQRKDIYMVFKEAINNAVKYSQATEVNISFYKNENSLRMVITDNGDGFDADESHSGNGLKNMQVRAREMNGTMKIESIKGTGTTIALEIAIT
jgi:signal transduction histidine kinase/ligand-binding sensor domain-containing protein